MRVFSNVLLRGMSKTLAIVRTQRLSVTSKKTTYGRRTINYYKQNKMIITSKQKKFKKLLSDEYCPA